MPNFTGPSHHLYYNSLRHRFYWLCHLALSFEELCQGDFSASAWPKERADLDRQYAHLFTRLIEAAAGPPPADSGGRDRTLTASFINMGTQLHQVLDDTPIESFLHVLTNDLHTYQHALLELMQKHPIRTTLSGNDWETELVGASTLWGRQLAQEQRILSPTLLPSGHSVRGIFEAFHHILLGGDFTWRPLLVRRYTDRELEYELRTCPHRTGLSSTADLACRLESAVYQGFAQALIPQARFKRDHRGAYCLDKVSL